MQSRLVILVIIPKYLITNQFIYIKKNPLPGYSIIICPGQKTVRHNKTS